MKLVVEFTFDENEWADYADVCPELVWEDMGFEPKSGVEMKIVEAEGFFSE